MKKFAWVAMAIAVMSAVGCAPEVEINVDSGEGSTTAAVDTSTDVATEQAIPEAEATVSIHVPEMHCPFACWPKVKETLEGQPGVAYVTLAKQDKEGVINDPTVHVGYNDGFDKANAVIALAKAGFDDSAYPGEEAVESVAPENGTEETTEPATEAETPAEGESTEGESGAEAEEAAPAEGETPEAAAEETATESAPAEG